MPNPKRKHCRARRDSRRSQNWRLEISAAAKCPNCGAVREPHRICKACGYYKDRVVVAVKEKKTDTPPAKS